jgi:hypothetical protein
VHVLCAYQRLSDLSYSNPRIMSACRIGGLRITIASQAAEAGNCDSHLPFAASFVWHHITSFKEVGVVDQVFTEQ